MFKKEYDKPLMEFIDFSVKDYIMTSTASDNIGIGGDGLNPDEDVESGW